MIKQTLELKGGPKIQQQEWLLTDSQRRQLAVKETVNLLKVNVWHQAVLTDIYEVYIFILHTITKLRRRGLMSEQKGKQTNNKQSAIRPTFV